MKILAEFLSSTVVLSLVCRLIIGRIQQNVISILIFSLLFTQCFTNDLPSSSSKSNNDKLKSTSSSLFDIKNVSIEQKSTTTTSSSSPFQRLNFSRRYGRRFFRPTQYPNDISTSYKSLLSTILSTPIIDVRSTTPFPPFSIKAQRTTKLRRKKLHRNDVLILIQTMENIKLNRVRDQFGEFIDMFGVKLPNVTIDFDTIDGK